MKKGQGALEFLMTYGWAFLVILIMIGALAYFGVLNPSKLLPDKCVFGPNVICSQGEFVIKKADTATLTVNLVNNFGQAVVMNELKVDTDFDTVVCAGASPAPSTIWNDGDKLTFTADCANAALALPEGTKTKFEVTVMTYPATSTVAFVKPTSGEIYTTIQP